MFRRLVLASSAFCLALAAVPSSSVAATATSCKEVRTPEATVSKIRATGLSCITARSLVKRYSDGFKEPKGYRCPYRASNGGKTYAVTCVRTDPSRRLTFTVTYKRPTLDPSPAPALPQTSS